MEFNNEVTFRTRFEKGVYLLERLGEAEGLMHFCQKALIGQASAFDKWAYLSSIASLKEIYKSRQKNL